MSYSNYSSYEEAQAAYHRMLEVVYGDVDVCGYSYSAADLLKEKDPTAYRCGFLDWCDSEGIDTDELEGTYED